MALERSTGGVVVEQNGGILFPMNDGSRLVPCRITAEALDHLTGGRPPSPARAFESVRLHVEILASAKYDDGRVGDDGVLVVGPDDVGLPVN